jgi:hypothetical protein
MNRRCSVERIYKKLRILEIYAVFLSVVFCVLALMAFSKPAEKFDEISVERLNIVEKNGQLIAVIANKDRMPDPIIKGKAFKTERVPGMIFYNGEGDECGGLIFGAVTSKNEKSKGQYGAYGGFTFDQFRQSQAMGLIYNDHSGSREVGLKIWDRPEIPLSEFLEREETINKMPESPEKLAEKKKLNAEKFSPTRIFIGKNKEKEAKITLYDNKGNARINMMVDPAGIPHLDFLNEKGEVTCSLPAK